MSISPNPILTSPAEIRRHLDILLRRKFRLEQIPKRVRIGFFWNERRKRNGRYIKIIQSELAEKKMKEKLHNKLCRVIWIRKEHHPTRIRHRRVDPRPEKFRKIFIVFLEIFRHVRRDSLGLNQQTNGTPEIREGRFRKCWRNV